MPKYLYKGRNKRGQHQEGQIEALNDDAAASLLYQKGIMVTRLQDASTVVTGEDFLKSALGLGRPKPEDLLIFARQMNNLMRAGVPIIRSLQIIADSTSNKTLKEALLGISRKLEEGKTLGTALQEYHLIFPNLVIAMVHVGENTGNLEEAFTQIGFYIQNEMDTQRRIKSATRYPTFVIIAILIAIGVINVFVIPSFKDFFSSFGGELPMPTKILLASSNFSIAYWPYMLIGTIGLIVSFKLWVRSDKGEITWGRTILKFPIIGPILEQALLARFCRSFAMTLKAGVPLLQALMVVSRAVDNPYVAEKILGMRMGLERGETLTKTAKSTGLFTPLVMQMLKIGEETGDVEAMLDQVAETYETDVDYALKGLSEAIEPILISVIAVIVLLLALGVFLPMWDLSGVALKG